MKRLFTLSIFVLIIFSSIAQINNGIKYQAVARDSSGAELKQKQLSLQISILQGSSTGTASYIERHTSTTNSYGLFTITIGGGTAMAGNFGTINWANGPYYIKVEMDINSGTNYKLMGTTQLLSVPYSKYADVAGKSLNDMDTSSQNELQTLFIKNDSIGISNGNKVKLPNYYSPDSSCINSLNITAPAGYSYSGDYIIPVNSNIWQNKANIPTARGDCFAAVINNKIYVIGGQNSNVVLSVVEEYDPITNSWTTKASMPTARSSMACEVVSNKVYVIGGWFVNNTTTNVVEEYNPVTNTWATKTAMPTTRCEIASSVVNNKIYVFGGWNNITGNLNLTEEYDPSTDSWTTKANMTTTRRIVRAAAVNGKIYVIGGFNTSLLTTNEEYDPSTNSWATKTGMTLARGDGHIGVIKNKIYYVGGYTGSNTTLNEVYDPVSNSWEIRSDIPIAEGGGAFAVYDNHLYVIGGGVNATVLYNTNFMYTPEKVYYIHCKK